MEHLNQSSEKKERIVWYIKEFRKLTEKLISRSDFEPNATIELDGYEWPNTFLYRKLKTEGINFTEITWFDDFLARCISKGKTIQEAWKDQLYHVLVGSTRRPYHDIMTWKLYEDISQRKEFYNVLDDEKLAEELIKVWERIDKINQVTNIIAQYREEIKIDEDKTRISNMQNQYWSLFKSLWVNILYAFSPHLDRFMDQVLFDGKSLYKCFRENFKDVNKEEIATKSELAILDKLKTDPFYHLVLWSTPNPDELYGKIFDDKKLAQILVDFDR